METSALLMMIPTWSVIIFFTVYFMAKALKTQHSHDGEE